MLSNVVICAGALVVMIVLLLLGAVGGNLPRRLRVLNRIRQRLRRRRALCDGAVLRAREKGQADGCHKEDAREGRGPLQGLAAGLAAVGDRAVAAYVSSTDVPLLHPRFIRRVLAAGISSLLLASSCGAQVTFRHNFSWEFSSVTPTTGFDGSVLEIKIGAGAFTDIVTAGGSFVTGGYTHTISTAFSSPIAGRPAWSGIATPPPSSTS